MKKIGLNKNISFKTLKFIFSSAPGLSSFFLVFEILLCIFPIISSKVISYLIDLISGNKITVQTKNIILFIAFYVTINILSQILSPLRYNISEKLSDKIAANSELSFMQKITSLNSINCFENSDFFTKMQLAKNGSGIRLISSLQMFSSFLRGLITLALSTGYLLQVHWLIAIISLVSVIPNSYYNFWVSKNREALFRSKTESSKKLSYYSQILTTPTFAKEIRLFNIVKYIMNKYSSLFNFEYSRINKVRKKQCLLGVLSASLGAICNGAAIVLFFLMAMDSKLSIGDIVLYVTLLPQFINGLQMLINSFSQTKGNNYYIKHFFDFMEDDFGEINGNLKLGPKTISSITVNNLSYKYPNANEYALKNINFTIDKPSLIAIVGENGSGKSTLIKIMMKLLDATSGNILINGIPIQDYDVVDLRDNISGVFQDPARFGFTVYENLLLSSAGKKRNKIELKKICSAAGIDDIIDKLPNGINTILDKQFEGGIDLSSGQWQRISLARALASNASVLFFDEASADLDPFAEKKFYNTVKDYSKNKIAFYITHRLSGTKDADLIIVLKNGEVSEIGKHDDLMKNKNQYYHLYRAQADGYVTG